MAGKTIRLRLGAGDNVLYIPSFRAGIAVAMQKLSQVRIEHIYQVNV